MVHCYVIEVTKEMSATTRSKVTILIRCILRNVLNVRVAHFLDFKRPCRDIKVDGSFH